MSPAVPLHVVILAAGAGQRMRSLLPKVLHRLAGQPLLAHVLAAARALKPAAIHVVYGHGGDQVRAAFQAETDLNWVVQNAQLGTGHALQQALPGIPNDARVLVLYGDVPLIRSDTLRTMLEAMHLLGVRVPLAVLTAEFEQPEGYGRIVQDDNGYVLAIVEEKDASPAQKRIRTINTGMIVAAAGHLRIWLAEINAQNAQGEFLLTDIFALANAAGSPAIAVGVQDVAEALGVNDAWQLAHLERRYQQRATRQLALAGVRMADPARVEIRGQLQLGCDVEMDIDVILEGDIELGDQVQIGPFCRLRNVRLGAGTQVLAHSDLDGVISAEHCRIGPYARLRPGTTLAANAHIGNFVETKQTQIGAGSKANHLSYLGDADIGANVNIGAGTITCNYDGANKHRTSIADGVFVGSNSALIAPVSLAENATIGAGSVITKNAPADTLTVARAKQISLPAWQRPRKS